MTLSDFFSAMTAGTVLVTIHDSDDSELARIYASGSSQLLTTLLARTVSSLTIQGANAVVVKLTAA